MAKDDKLTIYHKTTQQMANLESCPFCNIPSERIIYQDRFWMAVKDQYPVSPGHVLMIPKEHFETYFDLPPQYAATLHVGTSIVKRMLEEEYHPDGWNLGCNCMEAGGQTIRHFHLHLIPRYNGDVDNPRGGVRGVIPSKQNY